MNKNNTLTDDDPCPFGKKYKGIPLKDVPVSYLHWVWENVKDGPGANELRGYIFENMNVLKEENEDLI